MKICDICKGHAKKDEIKEYRDGGLEPEAHPVTGEPTILQRVDIVAELALTPIGGPEGHSKQAVLCQSCFEIVASSIGWRPWLEG